jgi:hypothetical protein
LLPYSFRDPDTTYNYTNSTICNPTGHRHELIFQYPISSTAGVKPYAKISWRHQCPA